MGRKTRPVVESRIKENLGLNRREDIESARNLTAWRGVLFSSATVASRTNFVTGRFEVGFVLDKSEIAL